MLVVNTVSELRKVISEHKSRGKSISLVPTMGALHEGHLSLVRLAHKGADVVVVSIFVNPTQFGPNEDYLRYPRTPEKDCELLQKESVEIVYMPSVSEMYSPDSKITISPGTVAEVFEGKIRQGHFQGVLTVVAKLFHQVEPDSAVFGQKDAQQLFLIRRMVKDLDFSIRIVEGETLREPDGLAMSSRNIYLKSGERKEALVLQRALRIGERLFNFGSRSLSNIVEAMRSELKSVPSFSTEYATAVTIEDFQESDPLPDDVVLVAAGRLGSVRLIDNVRPRGRL